MQSEIYQYADLALNPAQVLARIAEQFSRPSEEHAALLALCECVDQVTLDEALMLLAINADYPTLLAALCVDPKAQQHLALASAESQKIAKNQNVFNELAALNNQENPESLRRMLLVMVEDPRAVLLTLVRQIRRLRQAIAEQSDQAWTLAENARKLYAPLAGRLGVAQLKWELEDLSFRVLENAAYRELAKQLEERRLDREAYIEQFLSAVSDGLRRAGFADFEIGGRVKHLYSIHNKMRQKKLRFDQLYDIRAVRILLPKTADCYAVLGLLHGQFSPVPGQFDDYIGQPKANGYQSLHTVVLGPSARAVEVQIRSFDMHREAELGVAAHWQYKEGGQDLGAHRVVQRLRALLEQGDVAEHLQNEDLFTERVFALTPQGDVIDLAQGATPLDFAYAIHTSIGHRCRGAKVNGEIVPLSYSLQNAQTVEILTSKEESPSRDWLMADLGYLKTQRARTKVRHYFNQLDHDEHLRQGKEIVERLSRRHNIEAFDVSQLVAKVRATSSEALYVNVGRGDTNASQITAALEAIATPSKKKAIPRKKASNNLAANDISVQGVGQLKTSLAQCCQPVPNEEIIGLITKASGVSVHRRDCINMLNLPEHDSHRLISVEWGGALERNYGVGILLLAYPRDGLLRDLGQVLANQRVALIDMRTKTNLDDGLQQLRLDVELADATALGSLLHHLQLLNNVVSAERVTAH